MSSFQCNLFRHLHKPCSSPHDLLKHETGHVSSPQCGLGCATANQNKEDQKPTHPLQQKRTRSPPFYVTTALKPQTFNGHASTPGRVSLWVNPIGQVSSSSNIPSHSYQTTKERGIGRRHATNCRRFALSCSGGNLSPTRRKGVFVLVMNQGRAVRAQMEDGQDATFAPAPVNATHMLPIACLHLFALPHCWPESGGSLLNFENVTTSLPVPDSPTYLCLSCLSCPPLPAAYAHLHPIPSGQYQ